ncbi:MAG: hypothetical protein ACRDD7_09370 [Peptostreptococcaceae bacterium]
MFANFNKAFKDHFCYKDIKCKDCDNKVRCIENGIIFKYADGTYQPVNNHSYFKNYGCRVKEE